MNDPIPTSDGLRLIAEWLGSLEEVRRAQSRLSSAECDARNTEGRLAKWLMPEDMKPGEKVAVWMGDSLFQVELVNTGGVAIDTGEKIRNWEPRVTVRSRGKEFHRLAAA